ncbi:hypothetical protein CBR_g34305 [Chara braunii]|uniref:DNA 3'-5' helicase n=1 Tax=Chara braunii TaxID=69332 RepID=A0A388JYP6_CHABU|nr:hypothetical protein CBR_g34305 [Chara braunii]|eukprot:GBG62934.1 hypothetical protein CBR_g34305 [Chara braunii]
MQDKFAAVKEAVEEEDVEEGPKTNTIISVLDRLSKAKLPHDIVEFIRQSTTNYGKVKLVLQKNRFFVESQIPHILKRLLQDDVIAKARIIREEPLPVAMGVDDEGLNVGIAPAEMPGPDRELLGEDNLADPLDKEIHSFEVDPDQVEHVKQRCLPNELNFPMLEEYDFKNDTINPDLDMEIKPMTTVRPYQEKSLCKMFGNGRARSGIIVLPCGAGKSLVGVSAAARVKKSCLCLATNSVSVDQWRLQFKLWSTIKDEQIIRFTSESKEKLPSGPVVVVTTFNMIAFGGHRSEDSEKIIEEIRQREWGLLLMDELYEANWIDLVRGGFIANVQCAEVWCPMTKEFYAEYLKKENTRKRQALYVMNPNKFRACEFLIRYHEQQRRDKIIVFSDNIFALREYAMKLKKPFIYGPTSHNERTQILYAFKHSPDVNTIFLSKVGDNSIDIPEANVIIQISSHAGSRRQEAQRLGRILRAKGKPKDRMAGGAEEFNAFFYSLVSNDTQEMYYSTKRQQFLIDQGYSFKVITGLPPRDAGQDLCFGLREEQLDMLRKVLAAGEEEAGLEKLAEDEDDINRYKTMAYRTNKSMANMSGADGMMYMEYSTGRGGPMKGSFARGMGPKKDPNRQRHSLFKKRFTAK